MVYWEAEETMPQRAASAERKRRERGMRFSRGYGGLGIEKLKEASEKAEAWREEWSPYGSALMGPAAQYPGMIRSAQKKIGEMGDLGPMYGGWRAAQEQMRNRLARGNMAGTGVEEAGQRALAGQAIQDIATQQRLAAGAQAAAYGGLAGQVGQTALGAGGLGTDVTRLTMDPYYRMAEAYLGQSTLEQQLAMQRWLAKHGSWAQMAMQGRQLGQDIAGAWGTLAPFASSGSSGAAGLAGMIGAI